MVVTVGHHIVVGLKHVAQIVAYIFKHVTVNLATECLAGPRPGGNPMKDQGTKKEWRHAMLRIRIPFPDRRSPSAACCCNQTAAACGRGEG